MMKLIGSENLQTLLLGRVATSRVLPQFERNADNLDLRRGRIALGYFEAAEAGRVTWSHDPSNCEPWQPKR